jgi:hypothetical protein
MAAVISLTIESAWEVARAAAVNTTIGRVPLTSSRGSINPFRSVAE